jgi:hypothetical protein
MTEIETGDPDTTYVREVERLIEEEQRCIDARTLSVRVRLAALLKTSAEVMAICADLEDGFYLQIDHATYTVTRDGVAFLEGGPLEPGSTPEQEAEYERECAARAAEWDLLMAEGELSRHQGKLQ